MPDTLSVLIKLLRTSTFRLAVIYLVLFAASAALLLAYVYWNTAGFLVRQTDEAVQAEITGLAEQYAQGGFPLLVRTVVQRMGNHDQSLYLVLDPAGRFLVGNLDSRPTARPGVDGWIDFTYNYRKANVSEQRPARARAFYLRGGYYLLVGRDVQARRAVESLISGALFWAVGLTAALGLAGGLVMSRNMLARIDDINRSSRAIMGGNLSSRLPVRGTGDELDQLSLNLNAMLAQIESLMTGMRQVTDNIAHDLRSPLNRIRNRLEISLLNDMSEDESRQTLEWTIGEADKLLKIFNALLMIARAEAGSQRESMESVDPGAVVRDAVELYEPLAEEKGLSIAVNAEDGLVMRGNRELLSQALINLMDNAIRHSGIDTYTGTGGPAIIVSAYREEPNLICLSVADRGVGIAQQDRTRVLERFVRLENSRNTPGSGLGLSLAAAIARLHGGKIDLRDHDPGLNVVMSLPANTPAAEQV